MIASNIATNLLAFIIVLGVLIYAHEAGHFAMAKLFRVRVLVFSFGFGKRLFGFRKGDTDYRVSLIPLGGYVRMAGDTPEENLSGDPGEFLSKPKWQRFLILLAGPAVNLIIAVLFVAALSMVGTEQAVIKPVLGEILPNKPAARAGLQVGDRIVAINGDPIRDFIDLRLAIEMNARTPLRVEYIRNGLRRTTILTPDREQTEFGPVGRVGILPFFEPIIGRVTANSPAARAGLRTGDRIVAVNGQPVTQMTQFDSVVTSSKGKPIVLELARGTTRFQATLPATKFDPQDPYRGFLPPTEIGKLSLLPALQDVMQQKPKMLRYELVT